jgi:tetratricopeptide (TPR) repeat protein
MKSPAALLGAIDARFRRLPAPEEVPAAPPLSLLATWRDAGALRWLILFQLLVYWASVVFSPLLAPDNDIFFHLAQGRYQDQHGRIPADSWFSFMEPRPYLDYYWAFQRLAFELWQAAGPLGLMLLRAAVATAAFGLLACFLYGRRRSGDSLLSALLVFSLVGGRLAEVLLVCRPFVFSYLFLLAMFFILELRPRWLPLLPAITILWINLHGAELPLLLAVLLAYAGDAALAAIRRGGLETASRRRLSWLAACVPALFVSPHGGSLVAFPFKSTAVASLYVPEMAKPTLAELLSIGFGPLAGGAAYGGTLLLFVLALAAVWRNLGRRRLQPAHLVLLAAAVYLVLQGYRFTVEFALLVLPLLAGGVFAERRTYRPVLASLLVGAVAGLATWQAATAWAANSRAAYPLAFQDFPEAAATFLEKVAPPGGKVYNSANYGGFLMWRLGERHRIMMDMELHSIFSDDDFFLNRTVGVDVAAFEAFAQHYQPDWLAISHNVARAAGFLRQSENWVPVAVDDGLILLVDKRKHPQIAEQWRLRALDPWRLKIEGDYRLPAEAVPEAERLFQLEPRGLRLPALLAQAAIGRGDLPAAEKYVQGLLECCPDNADSWNLSSLLQLKRGDLEGAAADLEKAIKRADPAAAKRLRGPLAHFLARLGDRQGALEQLRKRGPFYDPMSLEDLKLEVELLEDLGPPAEAAAARKILDLRSGHLAL